MKPKVSVILPVHNSARYLPEAVESLRTQNWPDMEIIAVDDGSEDNSVEVLNQLAGNDLTIITQPNRGPGAARNTGIEAATNEWIAFLDADDIWLPDKLRAQFTELRRHPRAAFCYSDFRVVDTNGQEEVEKVRLFGRPLFLELLKTNLLVTPSVMVHRECFRKAGLFNTTLRTGEDLDLWLRLAARFEGIGISRPLVLCRRWPYDKKYQLQTLERSNLLILERLFSDAEIARLWPQLADLKPKVYSWHYSVLAKSYLRHGRIVDFCRMAVMALLSHPAALLYLTRRGGMKGGF